MHNIRAWKDCAAAADLPSHLSAMEDACSKLFNLIANWLSLPKCNQALTIILKGAIYQAASAKQSGICSPQFSMHVISIAFFFSYFSFPLFGNVIAIHRVRADNSN